MGNPCEIETRIEMTAAVPTDSEPSEKLSRTPKVRLRKKKDDVKTALTAPQAIILIISILLMTVTLQVPAILYYKNQSASQDTRAYSIDGIDVRTCSVSFIYIYIPIL